MTNIFYEFFLSKLIFKFLSCIAEATINILYYMILLKQYMKYLFHQKISLIKYNNSFFNVF